MRRAISVPRSAGRRKNTAACGRTTTPNAPKKPESRSGRARIARLLCGEKRGTTWKTHSPATCPMKSAPIRSANGETARRRRPAFRLPGREENCSQPENAEDREAEQNRIDEGRDAEEPAYGEEQRKTGRIDAAPPVRVEEDVLCLEGLRHGRWIEPQATRREDLRLKAVRDAVGHVGGSLEDALSQEGAQGDGEKSETGRKESAPVRPGLRRSVQRRLKARAAARTPGSRSARPPGASSRCRRAPSRGSVGTPSDAHLPGPRAGGVDEDLAPDRAGHLRALRHRVHARRRTWSRSRGPSRGRRAHGRPEASALHGPHHGAT